MGIENGLDAAAGGRYPGQRSGGDLPLFRPEALAAAVDSGLGKPIAMLPVTWTVLAGFFFILATGFAIFLFFGTYSRMETATGVVKFADGDVRLAVPTGGIVSQVSVVDGQRVQAGDVLMVVDTRRRGLDGKPLDADALAVLDGELSNLTDRMRALNVAAAIEQTSLPKRIAFVRQEMDSAIAQETLSEQRLTLAEQALTKLEPVAVKGFVSGETMRQRRDEVILLKQSIADSRALQARLDGQITDLTTSAAERPMTLVQERGQLLDLIARSRRDRADAASQRGFSVIAPTSGTISAVQVARGQPVDPQMSLMTISPSERSRRAMAELFVPSRAIGFLERGQRVRIRYDAFPYQRFGSAGGTVTAISSGVLRPAEVNAAVRVEEPVYRVLVTLDSSRLTAYGKGYALRPGLALTGDIILERRSFARWLLDPITALRGRL